MINLQIAKIFYEISEYLAMDEVAFKPQAYEKVARALEGMSDDAADIYKDGGIKALEEIPGVGESMAEKMEEFIKTGKIEYYRELKKKCPVDLGQLTAVEGLGPKLIKILYQKLRVKTLADLEKAARAGKVAELPRFGPKVQENILRGIEFVKGGQGRMLLGYVLPLVRKIEKRLSELKEAEKVAVAGSVRRMKETVGDIDILVISEKPAKIMDYFCSMVEVTKVLAKGETRSSVKLYNGLDADLRVVSKKSFGSALQYFTGSKDHNIKTRQIAQDKHLKLNEYGVWRGQKPADASVYAKASADKKAMAGKQIAGRTEEEVYRAIGLRYIEPEMREDSGEIEIALRQAQGKPGGLPKLVELKDIKGDLQMHTTWSDGAYSIKEMAEEAKKLGYEYIAITDHAGQLRVAHALGKKEILAQWREIDRLNKSLKGIKILKGIEVDLDDKGRPEIEEALLAKFDVVLGAVHSKFRLPEKHATQRLVNAAKNPHIDILAHPTGRKVLGREEMALDMGEIFRAAKEAGTILEINAYPERLDLNDVNIRQVVELGVKLSLGTDAHSSNHLFYMELGVAQARRGWAEKKDIINCLSFNEIKNFFKK